MAATSRARSAGDGYVTSCHMEDQASDGGQAESAGTGQYFRRLAGSREARHLNDNPWEKLTVAVMGRDQRLPEGHAQCLRVENPAVFGPDRGGSGQTRLAQERRGANGYQRGHVSAGQAGARFRRTSCYGEQKPGQVRCASARRVGQPSQLAAASPHRVRGVPRVQLITNCAPGSLSLR